MEVHELCYWFQSAWTRRRYWGRTTGYSRRNWTGFNPLGRGVGIGGRQKFLTCSLSIRFQSAWTRRRYWGPGRRHSMLSNRLWFQSAWTRRRYWGVRWKAWLDIECSVFQSAWTRHGYWGNPPYDTYKRREIPWFQSAWTRHGYWGARSKRSIFNKLLVSIRLDAAWVLGERLTLTM